MDEGSGGWRRLAEGADLCMWAGRVEGSRKAEEGQGMQVGCENAEESNIKLELGNRDCGNSNKSRKWCLTGDVGRRKFLHNLKTSGTFFRHLRMRNMVHLLNYIYFPVKN